MRLYRRFERAIRDVLNAQIDARTQVLAVTRWPDAFDILDRAAEPVLQDAFRAGLTGKPVVECQLEPFLTRVIDIRKPDQVACDLTRRVIAPVFSLNIDTGQLERQH